MVGASWCEVACCGPQGQLVTKSAKAGDDTDGDVREIGVLAKRLACVRVRQVDLYELQPHGRDSVAQRDAGMRKSSGIEDQEGDAVGGRLVNLRNELVLRVALERDQLV